MTKATRDWMNDFDHYDPLWVQDPYSLWRKMRKQGPLARTKRFRGAYFPLKWDLFQAITRDTESFSSSYISVRDMQTLPPNFAPPITSDPPNHRNARGAIAPFFTRSTGNEKDATTRRTCEDLLAPLAHHAECDALNDYARHIPAQNIAFMFNISKSDAMMFRTWSNDRRIDFFRSLIKERRVTPGKDVISHLITTKIDGGPLDESDVIGTGFLLFMAGIDTTAAVIGASLLYLASHQSDQARLRNKPHLLPSACEEFLRAFAPVTTGRIVTKNIELEGCQLKAGRMVLLSFAAANRDPSRFEKPDSIDIGRERNLHAAFGMGIHRCLGEHMARSQLQIAVETWLRIIPKFRLDPAKCPVWTAGHVRGPSTVPVIIG